MGKKLLTKFCIRCNKKFDYAGASRKYKNSFQQNFVLDETSCFINTGAAKNEKTTIWKVLY